MSETTPSAPAATATTEPTEPQQPTQETDDSGTDVDHWKAQAREWEKRAKENKDAARKLQEIEDEKKSETEKLADKLTRAETEREQARLENLRLKVALDKGVPADLAARLQGDNAEELEADADKLLGLISPQQERNSPSRRPTEQRPGAVPSTDPSEKDDPLLNDLKQKLGIR